MAEKRITDLDYANPITGLDSFELSQLSTDVLIEASTISAQASDNSFNDSAAGFIAAGFLVGDRITSLNWLNEDNEIYVGTIETLTASKMTIASPNGDIIADEIAGIGYGPIIIVKRVSRKVQAEVFSRFAVGSGRQGYPVSADHTITSANNTDYIRCDSVLDIDITFNPNSSTPLLNNSSFEIYNAGSGDVTIVEGSGVTINPPIGGTLVIPPSGFVTIRRWDADLFDMWGTTVPV